MTAYFPIFWNICSKRNAENYSENGSHFCNNFRLIFSPKIFGKSANVTT